MIAPLPADRLYRKEEWLLKRCKAESETQFFIEMDDTRFVFVKDAAGEVTGLSLRIQGVELPPAKKVK